MRILPRAGLRLLAGSLLGASALGALATTPGLRRSAGPPIALPRLFGPVRQAEAAARPPLARPTPAARFAAAGSLLDEVGKLAAWVPVSRVATWKSQAHAAGGTAEHRARMHLWLGEYELAHNQQPERAMEQFRRVRQLAQRADPAYGLAAYDTALALFYGGAYEEAGDAFHRLVQPRTSLAGYDARTCALWYRRAAACGGYHSGHARLGIPEPRRLDPLCAPAGLAVCLRALHRPYDKTTVAAACRHTGEGSNAQDLLDACRRLGLAGRVLCADDKGLKALPKPLIAYVEHDHFIAVVGADARGVSYICSDCGCWPGGRVNLTWKQWHALNPGTYVSVTRKGSATDQALAEALPAPGQHARRYQVAAGSLSALHLTGFPQFSTLVAVLRGHLFQLDGLASAASCGIKGEGLHPTGYLNTPYDGGCGKGGGPMGADPVNLATGEEEYQSEPDLVVYNPTGPSIVWQRLYDSLRAPSPTYQADDFGAGWSHQYNIEVLDLNSNPGSDPFFGADDPKMVVLPNGARVSFTMPGPPTSDNPRVLASAGAGAPFVLEWDYDANDPQYGHYTIIFPDRTRWITTTATFIRNGSGPPGSYTGVYSLARIEDPRALDSHGNASALVFNPSGTLSSNGLPLIASISDSASGKTLLTIKRNGTQISEIDDAYGRAVHYATSSHATVNVDVGNQSYVELDQVSQITSAGYTTWPIRWQYGYASVGIGYLNGSGVEEQVPFLGTISVPSPTNSGGMSQATIEYVSPGYVKDTIDANGNKRSYMSPVPTDLMPDGDPTLTRVTVQRQNGTVDYSYTVKYDNLERTTYVTDGTNSTQVVNNDYDGSSNPNVPSAVTDALGNKTQYLVDDKLHLQSVTLPSNRKMMFNWEYGALGTGYEIGRLASTQEIGWNSQSQTPDPKPVVSITYQPDAPGSPNESRGLVQSVTTATAPNGSGASSTTVSYVHDSLGDVTSVTWPGKSSTVSTLTANFNYTQDGTYQQAAAIGEPLTVTDPKGDVSHFRYSQTGFMISATDANANTTTTSYNGAGQPVLIHYPMTGQTGPACAFSLIHYLYPGGPALSVSEYDESGSGTPIRVLSSVYGPEGELLARKIRNSSGVDETVAATTYDSAYRILSTLDGKANPTEYSYGMAGSPGYLEKITYPANGDIIQFQHDIAGRLQTRTDGQGVVTTYQHDSDDRLTQIQYPGSLSSQDVHVDYDDFGRPGTVWNDNATLTYAYDLLDNVTSVGFQYAGMTGQPSIGYTYWPDGSRHVMTTPAGSVSYAYNLASDLSVLTNNLTGRPTETTTWSHQSNGWFISQQTSTPTLQNLVTTTFNFLPTGLLSHLTSKNSGGAVLSDFGGDAPSNLMLYDGAGNRTVMTASIPAAGNFSGRTAYAFDNRNQLLQESSTRFTPSGYNNLFGYDLAGNPGGGSTPFRGLTHQYNANNQVDMDAAYAYDHNGCPTTYQKNTLTFDPEYRMTAYGSTLTAGYGPDGLRVWKNTANGQTFFLYDGDQPIIELNASGAVTAVNTYGANGLISRYSGGASVFYTFDPQGNLCQRLDSTGAPLTSYLFDAFGVGQTAGSSNSDPFGFGAQWGYYTDRESGLLLTNPYCDLGTGRLSLRRRSIG